MVHEALLLLLLSSSVVSHSVRPRRRQPARLPHPWDSPGKNTGVGCHFLLQCMKVKSESEVAQLCPTQRPHGLKPTRLLRPWDSPGKSTGVGCHCLPRDLFFHSLVDGDFSGFLYFAVINSAASIFFSYRKCFVYKVKSTFLSSPYR